MSNITNKSIVRIEKAEWAELLRLFDVLIEHNPAYQDQQIKAHNLSLSAADILRKMLNSYHHPNHLDQTIDP